MAVVPVTSSTATLTTSRPRSGILPFTATTLIALTVYLFTLAPGLTWQHFGTDGGELITAATTLGVAHPPGYPTYIVLGKLWSLLPVGNMAWRFNLFSAVTAAVACGISAVVATHFARSRIAALAVALALAFTSLVWSQAIITEVYSLNLLMVALFVWAVVVRRSPWLSGLFFGLAATTHLTSWLLLPLVLLLPVRRWPAVAGGALIGLLPLGLLPLFSAGDSPVRWGDATTPAGFWWLVSGALYQPTLVGYEAQRWQELGWTLVRQFAWIGLPFALVGIVIAPLQRKALVLVTLLAIGMIGFSLWYGTPDSAVNLLPALLLLSLPMAVGLTTVKRWALILPVALLLLNGSTVSLRGDSAVEPLAIQTLQSAPDEAILLTPGDRSIFTLWYAHHVEGVRPDLTLVDANLFAFDWYRAQLQEQYPHLQALSEDDLVRFEEANLPQRPICQAALLASPPLICQEAFR